MKATGIVRRIDDLGRVVIPKEIRKTLRIKEGQPLEIFTEKTGEIIFKKYSTIGELSEFSKIYAKSINKILNTNVLVCDISQIVVAVGQDCKDYLNKEILKPIEEILEKRTLYSSVSNDKVINIIDSPTDEFKDEIIMPIISEGDILGGIIILSKNKLSKTEEEQLKIASHFIASQMTE